MTFVMFAVTLACRLEALEFHVAPNGRDGALGTIDDPFGSICQARNAARRTKSHVTVFLRGGTYTIREPVVFGRDDGNATYQAFKGETPVFTSAVPVTSWRKVEVLPKGALAVTVDRLWVADIPDGVRDFKVMFDGNCMLERARSRGFQAPEQAFKRLATRNVARPEDRPLLRRLQYPEGEIKAWDNIEDVEACFCGVPWTFNISPIASVDSANNIAWLKYEGNTPPFTTPKPYNPAYIENVIDVLDQPGEWCVNTKTRKIYYWPISGNPGSGICVPTLTEFFRVEGKVNYDGPVDVPVRNITFRGLSFTQGDRYSWWKGHKGWGIQHDWDKFDHANALLRFRGAADCTVEGCRFVNSGNSGIRLDLHAQNIVIKDNLINRVGHMGILLCGYGPGTKDVNKGNRIINNLIRRTGELIWHGHAIFVWQSGGNHIANNLIREVPRKAIGLCGVRGAIFMEGKRVDWDEASKTLRWDELGCDIFSDRDGTLQKRLLPFLHCRNNLVENNIVYRGRTKIGDGACLNVSGAGTGNVMSRNMLHVTLGNGMRCDDWQEGTIFKENLILSGGVVHKGRNDLINNIFINSNIRFSLYPGQQPDPGSKVHNNIFYFTRDNIVPYTGRTSKTIKTPESCDLKSNLYFCRAGNAKLEAFLAGKQAAGMDKGSRVADPCFERGIDLTVDAEPGGFHLAAGSPALALGFRQIDAMGIGLTGDYPAQFMSEVFPWKRGICISHSAKVAASSTMRGDASRILNAQKNMAAVFETREEAAPHVIITLDRESPVNGLYIVADFKDRQNAMRALTVWTSRDQKSWSEIWRADPYHIAMGRDWLVNPNRIFPAKYIKVGLRPKSQLQFRDTDERMKTGKYALKLNRIQVFKGIR